MKERIVVVCPGRGSYLKESLGTLTQGASPALLKFLTDLDERRSKDGIPTVTSLDQEESFKPAIHTVGENASTLIYACSYADFIEIDRERFEIVAITGNSMGWYIALSLAASLDWAGSYHLIQSMGSMMLGNLIGGQIIYPLHDEHWHVDLDKSQHLEEALRKVNNQPNLEAHDSIYLGGYRVIGGNSQGIDFLLKNLDSVEHFPFQLVNHAAYHTPLMKMVSERAFEKISHRIFRSPEIPLIDGQGKIWQPYSTDREELYRYTLGHQVTAPYNFSKSIQVALKEFAPDHIVLLGPGNSLGASLGQICVQENWKGIRSKSEFIQLQETNPFVISMGLLEQKSYVTTAIFD